MGRDQGPPVVSNAKFVTCGRVRTSLCTLTHVHTLFPRLTLHRNHQIPVCVGVGYWSELKNQKWNHYSVTVCQVTALAVIDAWKVLKERRVTGEIPCFSWSWPRQNCFIPCDCQEAWWDKCWYLQTHLSGKCSLEIQQRDLRYFLKVSLAGIWQVVCMERKGAGTQSAEQRPVGLGVPLLIPCTCTAALTNSRALFSSATPNPPLSFQCVSNPSTTPKLHLTPITQVIKLLCLGLSSIFFFDNYNFWAWNNRASLWRRVHSWFM